VIFVWLAIRYYKYTYAHASLYIYINVHIVYVRVKQIKLRWIEENPCNVVQFPFHLVCVCTEQWETHGFWRSKWKEKWTWNMLRLTGYCLRYSAGHMTLYGRRKNTRRKIDTKTIFRTDYVINIIYYIMTCLLTVCFTLNRVVRVVTFFFVHACIQILT